jgi:hypothetical protein
MPACPGCHRQPHFSPLVLDTFNVCSMEYSTILHDTISTAYSFLSLHDGSHDATIPSGSFTLYFHVFSAPKPFPSRLTCWVMTLALADHFLFFFCVNSSWCCSSAGCLIIYVYAWWRCKRLRHDVAPQQFGTNYVCFSTQQHPMPVAGGNRRYDPFTNDCPGRAS